MNLLLDTHVLFSWLVDDPHLSDRYRGLILETAELSFVRAVSAWEIAIKVKLGKWPEAALLLPDPTAKVSDAGLELLPLSPAQAERAGSFSLAHRDPFDRMLAAQAIDLDLTVLTVEPALIRLGCKVA